MVLTLIFSVATSQTFDNAAPMSGVHSGVQARIQKINPKALYVPCSNHSLNLCGIYTFACEPTCTSFFGTLESIYTFFSASIQIFSDRWDVLTQYVNITVKRICETRWSAQYDAVKPVLANFDALVEAIEFLRQPEETLDTTVAAENLLPAICNFIFIC